MFSNQAVWTLEISLIKTTRFESGICYKNAISVKHVYRLVCSLSSQSHRHLQA